MSLTIAISMIPAFTIISCISGYHAIYFSLHLTSHSLLTAHDLGAPAALLQDIYDEDAPNQRPLDYKWKDAKPNDEKITEKNWTKRLGQKG